MRDFFAIALMIVLWPGLSSAQTLGDAPLPPDAGSAPLPYGLFVSPTVSTLGLGLDVGVRLNETFGLRLGGNYFGLDDDREIDDVDYDVDATLASFGALVDYHPFGGGFRLSGGLRYNLNQADLTGQPNDDVQIGNVTFTAAQVGTLDADVDYNPVAPYLGIGYGAALLKGSLSIGFDLGVMYQGQADVSLASNNGLLSGSAALAANLAIEEDEIEDDLENFAFYPVLGLGIVYRF